MNDFLSYCQTQSEIKVSTTNLREDKTEIKIKGTQKYQTALLNRPAVVTAPVTGNSHVDALLPDLLFVFERLVLLGYVAGEAVLTAVRGQRGRLSGLLRRLPVRL